MKVCSTFFLHTGTYIMCAKFHENQTKTVRGVTIWKKVGRQTSTPTDRQTDTSITYTTSSTGCKPTAELNIENTIFIGCTTNTGTFRSMKIWGKNFHDFPELSGMYEIVNNLWFIAYGLSLSGKNKYNKTEWNTIVGQQLGSIFPISPRTSHETVFYTRQNLRITPAFTSRPK